MAVQITLEQLRAAAAASSGTVATPSAAAGSANNVAAQMAALMSGSPAGARTPAAPQVQTPAFLQPPQAQVPAFLPTPVQARGSAAARGGAGGGTSVWGDSYRPQAYQPQTSGGSGGSGGSGFDGVVGAANQQAALNQGQVLQNTRLAAQSAVAAAGIMDAAHIDRVSGLMTSLFGPDAMQTFFEDPSNSVASLSGMLDAYTRDVLPGIMTQSRELAGQAAGVVTDLMSGNIPEDARDSILRNVAQLFPNVSAERFSNVVARDLGLTSLDLVQSGLQQAGNVQAQLGAAGELLGQAIGQRGALTQTQGELMQNMSPFLAGLTDLAGLSANIAGRMDQQMLSPDAVLSAGTSVLQTGMQIGSQERQTRWQIASNEFQHMSSLAFNYTQLAENARQANQGVQFNYAQLAEQARSTNLETSYRYDALNANLGYQYATLQESARTSDLQYTMQLGSLLEQIRSNTMDYDLNMANLTETIRAHDLDYSIAEAQVSQAATNALRSYNLSTRELSLNELRETNRVAEAAAAAELSTRSVDADIETQRFNMALSAAKSGGTSGLSYVPSWMQASGTSASAGTQQLQRAAAQTLSERLRAIQSSTPISRAFTSTEVLASEASRQRSLAYQDYFSTLQSMNSGASGGGGGGRGSSRASAAQQFGLSSLQQEANQQRDIQEQYSSNPFVARRAQARLAASGYTGAQAVGQLTQETQTISERAAQLAGAGRSNQPGDTNATTDSK